MDAPSILRRIPTWAVFIFAVVALFAGIVAIALLGGERPDGSSAKEAAVAAAPLWVLAGIETGEGLLWTVFFTEAFARVWRAPWTGMLCGLFAYSVLYHASGGIAVSGWIGLVCGVLYLVLRGRSRWSAALAVVGLRWCFGAMASYLTTHFASVPPI
jgi:hypothetical protein